MAKLSSKRLPCTSACWLSRRLYSSSRSAWGASPWSCSCCQQPSSSVSGCMRRRLLMAVQQQWRVVMAVQKQWWLVMVVPVAQVSIIPNLHRARLAGLVADSGKHAKLAPALC